MQIIQHSFADTTPLYPIECFGAPEKILFIDIETTGLSPKSSSIYMIGCAFFCSDTLQTIQWFAEDTSQETDILTAFFELVPGYLYLLHFNGNRFDIPYLAKKAEQLRLDNPLVNLQGIDIYQYVRPIKKLLSLTSLRQKAIEDFLQIKRNDQYDGGQLIPVYKEYVQTKKEDKLALLLLHNKEDLLGMTKILPVLFYQDLLTCALHFCSCKEHSYEDFEGNTQTELIISYHIDATIPRSFSTYKLHLFLSCSTEQSLCFRIPFCQDELRHYYKNYKDYYYLPAEDCCIHKSVAISVDSDYRCPAKKDTCYSRHTGRFVPQFSASITPCFQREYKTSQFYFLYDADNLPTAAQMEQYGRELLTYFCK